MKKKPEMTARLSGVVVEGKRIGKKIGSPTINIEGEFDLEWGIYACVVSFRGERYLGAMHFGPRLTLNEEDPVLEVSLLDFDRDLYGETVEVEVYNKIREVQKFKDLKELAARIAKDIEIIRKKYDQIFKK